jgi:DNA repair protein RadC
MQEQKYSIQQWAKDDKSHEKLRDTGATAISDSGLMAL